MTPTITASAPIPRVSPAATVYTAPARASFKAEAHSLVCMIFAVDMLLVTASLVGAFLLRFYSPLQEYGYYDVKHPIDAYTGHLVLGLFTMGVILLNQGFYSREAILSHRRVFSTLLRGAGLWLLIYLAASLILRFEPAISRVYCVLAFTLMLTTVGAWRYALLKIGVKSKHLSVLKKHILMVGWNQTSQNLYGHVKGDSRQLNEVMGVIPAPGSKGFELNPPAHMRTFDVDMPLSEIFRKYDVDTVIVADLQVGGEDLVALSNACEMDMVDFKMIPSGFQILVSGLHLEHVSGVPVLGISRLPLHSPVNTICKRALDVAGALFGLLISVPIFIIFGMMIRRESPGPILYRQRRLGRDGKHFTIFKLRSMKMDSEVAGARWAEKNDPRCLKVGAFMRKWNIDELPQFWNVLMGDMSLVGPRPERPELIMTFKDSIPHYNARHNIKPGMTGWAQVNGLRGNTDLAERVQYDLFYIENWSLGLDIQIMLSTMFKRDNAY